MDINLKVFKSSGEYLTDVTLHYNHKINYPLLYDDFMIWVDENLPARSSYGYIVISCDDEDVFCERLCRLDKEGRIM